MEQEIEIEFKNLLTEDEFYQLVKTFKLERSFLSQTNYYFDTADFTLKEKGMALRIREKNGHYTLTLKQPHEVGLLESHEMLTKEMAEKIFTSPENMPDSFTSLLGKIQISTNDLVLLGSLATKRAEISYKSGLLVLDNSTYLGEEDFEVEFEVSDEVIGKADFLRLLATYDIPIRKTENKIKRFFNKKYFG